MKLNVRGASPEHNFELEVEPSWTVLQVKEHVANRLSLGSGGAERIRLISMARVMDNSRTVESYHIEDGQTLHMVLRQDASAAASPTVPTATAPAGGAPPAMPAADIFSQLFSALPQVVTSIQQAVSMPPPSNAGSSAQQPAPSPAPAAGAPQQPQSAAAAPTSHVHVQRMVVPAPQPSAGIAGFHVHVHVNLNELEELPERLARFQQRAAPLGLNPVTIHAPGAPPFIHPALGHHHHHAMMQHHMQQHMQHHHHHHQQAHHTAAAPQTAATAAAPQRPSPSTPAAAATASAGAEARPAAQPSAQQPAQSAGPRPSLADLAARAGVRDTDGPPSSLFDVLSQQVMSTFSVPDLMTLMGGNWTPMDRVRGPLRDFVQAFLSRLPESLRGAEGRQRLASDSARSLVQQLVDNPEVHAILRPRTRPAVNIFQVLENFFYHWILDLVHHVLDAPASAFIQPLRQNLVRHVGMFLHYSQRELFVNGGQDLDFVVQNCLRLFFAAAGRDQPQLQQQLTMMGPMALGIATNTLGLWQQEYIHRMRHADDDSTFTRTAPRFSAPPSAAPASPTVGGPSAEVDMDALLDEVMDATGNPPVSGTDRQQQAPSDLRGALVEAGLQPDEAREFAAQLETSSVEATPTAEDKEQHSELFTSVCRK